MRRGQVGLVWLSLLVVGLVRPVWLELQVKVLAVVVGQVKLGLLVLVERVAVVVVALVREQGAADVSQEEGGG